MDFGFGGRVGDVFHGCGGPRRRILVGLPPLPLPRVRGGRLVGAVVHPAVPLGRDIGGVVIVAVLVGENHPPISQKEIIIVLVIFVAVSVLAHQLAMLDLVVANELEEGTLGREMVRQNSTTYNFD